MALLSNRYPLFSGLTRFMRHVLLLFPKLSLKEACMGVRLDWLVLDAVDWLFLTLMLWNILA